MEKNKKLFLYLSYISIFLMAAFFAGIIIYVVKLGDRNHVSDVFVILSALNVIPFVASLMFIAFQYPRIPSKFGSWYQQHPLIGSASIITIVFLLAYAIIKIAK